MPLDQKSADAIPCSPAADPLVGRVLCDKYRIISRLASGGMGKIYRAEQLSLQRLVAVKVLHAGYVSRTPDPAFRKRFFREASILANLQNPHIVTVFDYGPIEYDGAGSFFMAMELLQGETLRQRIDRVGALRPADVLAISRQVTRGLAEAHRRKIVHRDLKPSNIMLVPDGAGNDLAKILDFGLIKLLAEDATQVTEAGAIIGSPHYMAPEQVTQADVDARADIYSLGIVMYQTLCGRLPFSERLAIETVRAHVERPVPPMRELAPDINVPEPLEDLVRRCLAKSPDDRPASMEMLAALMKECAHEIGIVPRSSESPRARASRSAPISTAPPAHSKRAARWALPVAIAALVVVVVGGLITLQKCRGTGSERPADAASGSALPSR